MDEIQQDGVLPHKRRVRYKGRYPRHFAEKYKELQPEKYAATVEKVMAKGSTPAGMHIPIMVQEILTILQIQPGMKGFDATLGYGGHTREMLKALQSGHLYAGDVDPIESAKTRARLEEEGFGSDILTVRHMNFSQIDELVAEVGPFDFILADLGVSSMQIDNPARGFSYKNDGPLDLRLDPTRGISAAERLAQLTAAELEGMLIENADEPYAQEIARQIVSDRKRGHRIDTTGQLHAMIVQALTKAGLAQDELLEAIKKSSARTFQALRIDVNHEYEVLYDFLMKLPGALASGGKAAILTFHSGEDRLVKQAFKEGLQDGLYAEIAKNVIRPSAAECHRNGRAHSTKLRWAKRR